MALDKDTEKLLRSMASQLDEYAAWSHNEAHSTRDGATYKTCTVQGCKDAADDVRQAKAMLPPDEPGLDNIVKWDDPASNRCWLAVRWSVSTKGWRVTGFSGEYTWDAVLEMSSGNRLYLLTPRGEWQTL